MTNSEMIKCVNNRIDKLVESPKIKEAMLKMSHEGKSAAEIQQWLVMAAVITLCGYKNS